MQRGIWASRAKRIAFFAMQQSRVRLASMSVRNSKSHSMLPSSRVLSLTQFAPEAYSVPAIFLWGASDFAGGYASRSANAFTLTAFSYVCAFALMLVIALPSMPPCLRVRAFSGRCWQAQSEDSPWPSSIALWRQGRWPSPHQSRLGWEQPSRPWPTLPRKARPAAGPSPASFWPLSLSG